MKVIVLLLLVVAAIAEDAHSSEGSDVYHTTPGYTAPSHGYKEQYGYAPANYKYDYAVKDDYYNDYGKTESREGDLTKGSYWVALPDGRRMVVTYYVDGYSGFVADVKYEGEIKPYDYKPAPYAAQSKEDYHHAEPKMDYHHPEPKMDYHHSEPKMDYHHHEPKMDYHHPEPKMDYHHPQHVADVHHYPEHKVDHHVYDHKPEVHTIHH